MQKLEGNLVFSPSDLCRFMESAFGTWMDRLYLETPTRCQPDPDSDTDKLLQERGIEHEKEFLEHLRKGGRDVCEITKSKDRFIATLQAMSAGREVIYQAALRDEQFIGYADFLIRVDGSSTFGPYQYEPWDTKLGLHAKPYYLIQLACYADLVEKLQGQLPGHIHLVLGNLDRMNLRTEDYLYYYRQVRQRFLNQQNSIDPDQLPDFTGLEDFGWWKSAAEDRIKELDHLCQVANIRRTQIRKLHLSGIRTMSQLAAYDNGSVHGIKDTTLDTLRHQAKLQVASIGLSTPKFEIISRSDGKGLVNLPPFSEMDVYFDMEGYPFAHDGLEYLFGTTTITNGEMRFCDWWAHTPEEEKRAFEGFIDWVFSRWTADRSMHIYHYGSYEKTALRKLMGRHATREYELDGLLRNEVFVDLLPLVRQSIRVGEPNYSIKSVEKLYRDKRHGEVSTAIDSVVFYKRWLDHQDGACWQDSAILADIRSYNKEDCDSTYQLTDWLRNLQQQNGIVFRGATAKENPQSDAAQKRQEATILAQQLLENIPTDQNQRTEKQRVAALLAHLLEFHWREAKPVFWAKYDRHAMAEDELQEDPCCLAGLKRTGSRPRISPSMRSILYEYEYDAEQSTRIDAKDSCFFAHDLNQTIRVESIDSQRGVITLRRSRDRQAPPDQLNLIMDEFVDASAIAESIYRIASGFSKGQELPLALRDLILRQRPRLRGRNEGVLLPVGQDLTESTIDVISRMDNTTLCIQGPPGSGKTYTAARAIARLMRDGKRVGVTSNSHKAVAKLLDEVATLMGDPRTNRIVKIQSDESDFEVKSKRVYKLEPKPFFDKGLNMFSLIGGTAWLFSDSRARGLCDYLFVDEAGQVSLANLVAMSPSTKNIVLIGDQMQLAQPLKGSHPGESGKSVLEYVLGNQEVIPEDFGIFLGMTRRMHPDVCAFISGAVYQGKLKSHADTAARVLKLPEESLRFIVKPTGILFIPVDHDGNTQDSEEEVNAIVEIVKELQKCSLLDQGAGRPVENKDILLVAPYNMQVKRLKASLPAIQAGSVDRFQGQEAPIVVVSMCASSGEGLSRGLEFLFSRNRLNVAISRAQTLAIVIGSPRLAAIPCSSMEQMELVNLYCRIMESHRQS
jgi:predicted RecB family nuclease